MKSRIVRSFVLTAVLLVNVVFAENEPIVKAGAGSYTVVLPQAAQGPQRQVYLAPEFKGKVPTNDWWSSLAWIPFSDRHFPHPLGVQAEASGLRVFHAGATITSSKDGVFGYSPGPGAGDLTIGHSNCTKFPSAMLASASDWFVTALFRSEDRELRVTYGHGSPFVFAQTKGGKIQISFREAPQIWSRLKSSSALGISIGNRHYGLFAPTGAIWTGLGSTSLSVESKFDYFSLALLPDTTNETFLLFEKHAHAHVVDTKVNWSFDQTQGLVTTTFDIVTRPMEGIERRTIVALYPHQWRYTRQSLLGMQYQSVRGIMKLMVGSQFLTQVHFPGILPCLPKSEFADTERMRRFLAGEIQALVPPVNDTYWQGKWMGRLASQIPIAETYGFDSIRDELLKRIQDRLESWLDAMDERGGIDHRGLFYYDDNWGTLIGYPASFGSDQELNDHHFHYGYFIRAAAEVAFRNPQWAKESAWGTMVRLLIRDIASPDRDDSMFPFLRNFDPFAGHSWASGHAKFADGNNNESSSEAMNAWYGIILWGLATNDTQIRDLGIYLYTTEMTAIQEYWFDVRDENHPIEYRPSVVTMVWGGKGANGTWFTSNPEAVHGINWLPITGGSLYLGLYPDYVRKNYTALVNENQGTQWDEWPDQIWMYQAFTDPDLAIQSFESKHAQSTIEAGNSLANTYHWITSLKKLGQLAHVKSSSAETWVSSDAILYSVFQKDQLRTYSTFNPVEIPREVVFSDGYRLSIRHKGWKVEERKISHP